MLSLSLEDEYTVWAGKPYNIHVPFQVSSNT